ncbi:hypothetical protein SAMN05192554_12939 [Haloarchaeobius iranensis]|uniref:Uncharacterized protein n=2 Tax=Haloarchaeobius iranensis TaxID=996166 RepID=A0A1H0AT56_9EURY|nr:hypothetical protein SAMN05192554_12939 [Haloarchaeobius iranensis]
MDAGLILGKMTLAYNGENYQGDINRTWDWLNGNRPYDIYQQPQVCYFLQFEVIGMDPDETAYLDLENWTGCELSENYTRIDLENQHDINVTAPSTSPSTVKQMTTAEMRDNGFHSATISEIKRAPNRYPIPNSRIESYPDDHEIIFGQPTANTFPER